MGVGAPNFPLQSSFTTFLVVRINYLYFLYFSSIISYKVSSAPVPSRSCQKRCEAWTRLDFISDLFQSVQNIKVLLKSQQTQELGFFCQTNCLNWPNTDYPWNNASNIVPILDLLYRFVSLRIRQSYRMEVTNFLVLVTKNPHFLKWETMNVEFELSTGGAKRDVGKPPNVPAWKYPGLTILGGPRT